MTTGAVAQLGARLHGMQKVRGSNPLSSTLKGLLFKTAGLFLLLSSLPLQHYIYV